MGCSGSRAASKEQIVVTMGAPRGATLTPEAIALELLRRLKFNKLPAAVATAPAQASGLKASDRGVSVTFLRAMRTFLTDGLDLMFHDVPIAKIAALIQELTASTGLSLAESLQGVARTTASQAATLDTSRLIGTASVYFVHPWEGGCLYGSMMAAVERQLEEMGEADLDAAAPKFIWIDLFAVPQRGGGAAGAAAAAAPAVAASGGAGGVRKEAELRASVAEAIAPAKDIFLWASPLVGEWSAPAAGVPLFAETAKEAEARECTGPVVLSRGWCVLELALAFVAAGDEGGTTLHLTLTTEDKARLNRLITADFDALDACFEKVEVRHTKLSDAAERDALRLAVETCKGGVAKVNEAVRRGLSVWLAREASHALAQLPSASFASSPLLPKTASKLQHSQMYGEAEPLMRTALSTKREAHADAPKHADVLGAAHALGVLLAEMAAEDAAGEAAAEYEAEAEALLAEAAAGREEVLGAMDVETSRSRRALGLLLMQRGELARAADLLREAAVALQQTEGAAHADTLLAYGDYADALLGQAEPAKVGGAKATLRTQMATAQKALGSEDPTTLILEAKYATALLAEGATAEGTAKLAVTIGAMAGVLGDEHAATLKYARLLSKA